MSHTTKTQDLIVLTPHDLPLHCNGPKNETWNGHPRVFLPIQSHSQIQCPYCGTTYFLDSEIGHHH
ncbi:zinc-finger domain-containing protein [Kingella kingae]|uniref:zinc-finger domain-containing protein n=1 Tax=Kingella kingae TaxID=504 RepID=UPI0004257A0F|nr:zinc-finger domain-containing protein [Kingella kingae]MDK4535716.1 zinc-finger domain-containing protein [Kingella kingae]MDK4538148.1 zinc-finger domain-containing protein [Kingella kingae]MDK4544790.1 zinc-finger domain-containing protein [Kingella kingae]MDK4547171.1 zinc-finger domain-containing protein [Kingella kingae]MDK4566794.1 zinc-finger domain-containing protein [Kingella kingae]